MANYCTNCGKKISLFDEWIKLNYAEVYFCNNCMGEVNRLLQDIRNVITQEGLEEAEKKFAKELPVSRLNEKARQAVKKEFDERANIAKRQTVQIGSHADASRGMKKKFHAGFEEAKEAILQTGKEISGGTLAFDVIKAGNVKTGIFIYENYFFRNNSYASLTVVLVSCENISTVFTAGSGGGDGMFGFSWGAEEDFEYDFWQTFERLFPQYPLEDCRITKPAKKRIGILGGTFDPVHKGHVALAEGAIRAADLQKLIVMPAKIQPFKLGKEITEDYHRLAMVKAAFQDCDQIEVSDYELNHTYISYTYDTLLYLKDRYPQDELFFILGTDAFLEVEYWHKGIELLENFSFIVGNRPGYRENELDSKIQQYLDRYHTQVIKVEEQMPDISSTVIKERIRAELPVDQFIPEAVERYIHDQRLYL